MYFLEMEKFVFKWWDRRNVLPFFGPNLVISDLFDLREVNITGELFM